MQSYPRYLSNWRGSETVMAMTAEQRGIYVELCDYAWEHGDLPTSEALLQQIARCKPTEWKRSREAVLSAMVEIDGRYHIEFIDKKRPSIVQAKSSRANSASKAAQARWSATHNNNDASSNAPRMDMEMRDASESQCERNAISCGIPYPLPFPSPSPSPSPEENQNHGDADAPPSLSVRDEVREVRTWFDEQFWPLYPRKLAKDAARKVAERKARNHDIRRAIIDGLQAQLPMFAEREIEHIPHASTWLSQGRWTDQPEVRGAMALVPDDDPIAMVMRGAK